MKKWIKGEGKKRSLILCAVFLLCFGWFIIRAGYTSEAADPDGLNIYRGATEIVTGKKIDMRSQTMTLSVLTGTSFSWASSNPEIVEIVTGSGTSQTVKLKALAKGETMITVSVTYTDTEGATQTKTLACDVSVAFSIDEDATYTHVKYIHAGDERKALVMNYGEMVNIGGADNSNSINLVFGAASSATWEIANQDIALVRDGKIEAVGAGRTNLTVSYSDGGVQYSDTIYVYVRPQITYDGSTWSEGSGARWTVNRGDYLEASMLFTNQPSVAANNKLDWVIYQTVLGSNVLVRDSRGNTGPNSNMGYMEYTATLGTSGGYAMNLFAGEYYIAFYVYGSYTNFDTAMAEDDLGCQPVVIAVKVNPNFGDKEISIGIDEIYDLSSAFNICLDQMANFTLDSTDPSNPFTTYGSFESSTWQFTAESTGTAYMTVTLNTTLSEIGLDAGATAQVKVVVAGSFTLNYSSYTMFVGQTLKLNGIIDTSTTNSTFSWVSSNETYASVSGSGLNATVTAKRVTPSNQPVKIRLYWTNEEGITKVASCSITIKQSITNITMNPASQSITVGDTFTIRTNALEEVNFHWISSDSTVATVTPNAGNYTATVVGAKPGTCVITVINLDNNVTATCNVTVQPALTSISIVKDNTVIEDYSINLLQKNVQLGVKYTPTTTGYTADMRWTSQDTTVAEVDNTGWVTMHKAGTTMLRVEPVFNPNNIYATCYLTVLQPPSDAELLDANGKALNPAEVTIEVGESVDIICSMLPNQSTAPLEWSVAHEDIAQVQQDENTVGKSQVKAKITALKGGTTDVMVIVPILNKPNADGTGGGTSYRVLTCTVHCIQGATGIVVDKKEITLNVGEMEKITATLLPESVTQTKLTWSSDDSKIATVDANGMVTAVSEGETSIFVQTEATGKQPTQTAKIKIIVRDSLQGISLDPTEKTIRKGKTFTIDVYYTPDTAANKDVYWESSDEEVATVSDQGKVKGRKGGVALITCTSDDGGFVAGCKVKVKEAVSSVTLNKTTLKLGVKKNYQLEAKVESEFATNPKLTWTSSKPNVVTVNKHGMIKTLKVGTATIKCKTNDGSGAFAKCVVKVVNPVKTLNFSTNYMKLSEGRSKTINTKISPANATMKKLTWTSSDTGVAVVSTAGKVTGVKEGTCIITAKANDGSGKKAQCTVVVTPLVAASGVVVAQKEITVVRGTRFGLNITVLPTNHTDTVNYSSDNKMVCTVNSSGTVSALRAGQATITIMTGSGKTNTVTVNVVALNKTTVNIRQYDVESIWVDGVTSGITWYSANPAIATVDNGTIVGKRKGTTYVYATINGCKLACKVKVRKLKKRSTT